MLYSNRVTGRFKQTVLCTHIILVSFLKNVGHFNLFLKNVHSNKIEYTFGCLFDLLGVETFCITHV